MKCIEKKSLCTDIIPEEAVESPSKNVASKSSIESSLAILEQDAASTRIQHTPERICLLTVASLLYFNLLGTDIDLSLGSDRP